ncbi:M23 family metallopeptidase [Paractinoplanes rishiriensis]|uniref:M23 family metallopeptidase n=1 Tax=Paractinoplanes rishiriensis TaxID=1050105 RepID=UPI001EF24D3E|nr:M23 family metallopeptidase [Actinoplanes rishiriensis]
MRVLRTLAGLSVSAIFLAACGGNPGGTSAAATPQFVAPSEVSADLPDESLSAAPPTSASPSASPSVSPSKSATPSPSASKKPATNVKYVFPVKASNVDYHPTHSKYPATDIFADCGEPVVATTSGVVLEVSFKDTYVEGAPDGPANGGLSVSIGGDDGVRYYGSHLSKVQSGIKAGVRVTAGQRLGLVGKTGNSSGVCHLHYGISPPCAKTGDWKVRRGVVWPATFLDSWRSGGKKSPVATVAAWKRSHNCSA